MRIGYDAKRYYHNHTGLGNYSRAIVAGQQQFFAEEEYRLYDEKSLSRTFGLGQKAKAEGCDLLHGLSNELPLNIGRVGLPSVVTMHDVAWRTFPNMYHWADRQIYDLKYGRSCRNATKVLAISESTKRDVMRYYGVGEERIEVIYQPVGELFYTPLSQEEADNLCQEAVKNHELSAPLPHDFVLNVGSINSRKNLLGLVKALELMPADQRPLLLVVGNGREYKREVLDHVARHGLESYVRIETQVRDNQVLQALYTRARLMAYPSHYEGFGLPVVEAALQHCPIVTSNVSSLPEAAGPGAVLCDPAQVESIHEALSTLIDDPNRAERMATEAESYARRNFEPKELAARVHELYEKTVGATSPRSL